MIHLLAFFHEFHSIAKLPPQPSSYPQLNIYSIMFWNQLLSFFFRYGYVDPFGEVREYSYQSGVECDPFTKQPLKQEDSRTPRGRKRGHFDYNANRYVTKDGRRGKLTVNKNNRRRG